MSLCDIKQDLQYYEMTNLKPIIDINTLLYTTPDFGLSNVWNDLSGNLRNGTVVGATRIPTHPLGLLGYHYNFNGKSNYINMGIPIIGDSIAFTISSWFKTTSTSTNGARIYAEANSTNSTPLFSLTLNDGVLGDVRFGIRDDNGKTGSVNYKVNANNGYWHNLVGVQRSKALREIYYDGVKLPVSNATSLGTVTVNNSKIGVQLRSNTYERYYSGDIGSILLYNRDLTDVEIWTNYQNSVFYYL